MILGMNTFTFVHVLISLLGIASGFVVLCGLFTSDRLPGWTLTFLLTTVATSVTGFGFHRDHLLPSHVVGVISLVFLAVAILALYRMRLAGPWRWIYVATAMASLYLNVFVLVVQSFQKIPPLHALAPMGTEPPFAATQGIVLLAFVVLGVLASRKFYPLSPA